MNRKLTTMVLGIFVPVAVAAGLMGCATTQVPQQAASLYVPTFSWSPKTQAPPASAGITVAVVAPAYGSGRTWTIQSGFGDFAKQLGVDFQQLLLSKGFTVKGPYDSQDVMTYEDKKQSELALSPVLQVSLRLSALSMNVVGYQNNASLMLLSLGGTGSTPVYRPSGEVVVGGRVTLIAFEPLTGQKLWVKDIALPDTTVNIAGTKNYYVNRPLDGGMGTFYAVDGSIPAQSLQIVGNEIPVDLLKDPGIETPIAKALESYFQQILDTTSKYIDVAEMKQLDAQSKEIRKHATFAVQQ